MISADFYPAAWNDTNVQASPTQLVQSIPVTTSEFSQAYWLGWIAWENVPQQYKISRYEIIDGKGIFTDVTRAENVPVGYTVNDDGSYVPAKLNAAILTNNGEKWQNITYPNHTTTAGNNVRLPNSLNINTVGYNGNVILCFIGYANSTEISGWLRIGITDFINDSNFTVTFTNGYELTTKPSDFNDYELMEFDVNDVHYKIALGMYTIEYARDVTISGGTYGYQGIRSMLQIHTTDDKPYIQSLTYPAHYQNNYQFTWGSGLTGQGAYIDYSGNIGAGMVQNTDGENVDIMGGFVGEFEISSMTVGTIIHPEDSTFYIRGIRSDLAIIGRIFTYDEIYKTLALAPRIAVNGVNQYVNSANFYYAKVDLETNEFLTEFVSGDKTAELTDWQIIGGNINNDEFTADDVPEYEPEEDVDEESGESIPIQRRLSMGAVSSFITCYGLTAAQVQEFGKKLWSSWVDNGGLVMAMVENFKFLIDSGIASNTGSINISSVLDFVVSLKVYPCDIRNLFAFSNSDSDGKVYIGRGTYGLEVSNTAIYKAINQLGYLDAGTYNVPRPFGDFRDYTNINITVYVPYCGTIELNPADVIGRTLSGTYVVDVMTGECTFFLEVIAVADSGEHRYIVGTCDGQLGVTIPISATNSGQIAARRFSDVAQFATTVGGFFNRNMQIGNDIAMQMATLGASGMASKNPEMASAREQNIKMTGSQAYANNALGLLKDVTGQFGNSLTRAAIDAPNISGGSGIASFANPDCVWIQIRHGIYPKVNNYNHTVGKVSTKSAPLSSYSGFTVCHNVDVSSLPCTEEEKSAIKQLLETGVYL